MEVKFALYNLLWFAVGCHCWFIGHQILQSIAARCGG